ncbi:nucleotidyltransferase domain-containing protein [Thermococcus atlanticus]
MIKILRKELEKHPEIIFAYLHGSSLEVEHFRDIDVAVYVDESVNDYLRYELKLATELEMKLGREVDVRVLNDAPPAFKYRVVSRGRVLLSRDEEKRFRFVENAVWEYLDFEPLERRARREIVVR